jgi:hypothetical protein
MERLWSLNERQESSTHQMNKHNIYTIPLLILICGCAQPAPKQVQTAPGVQSVTSASDLTPKVIHPSVLVKHPPRPRTLTLTWNPGSFGVSGYELQQGTVVGSVTNWTNSLLVTLPTATFTNLPPTNELHFRVDCFNALGMDSAWTSDYLFLTFATASYIEGSGQLRFSPDLANWILWPTNGLHVQWTNTPPAWMLTGNGFWQGVNGGTIIESNQIVVIP